MNIPYLPEGHNDLTRIIRYWADQNTIDIYLDLLAILLEDLELPNGHSQLVTNTGKPQTRCHLVSPLAIN